MRRRCLFVVVDSDSLGVGTPISRDPSSRPDTQWLIEMGRHPFDYSRVQFSRAEAIVYKHGVDVQMYQFILILY